MDLSECGDLEMWVAEMALRAHNWRESGKKLLYTMHLGNDNSHLVKLAVLRAIWEEVVNGTVSEDILDEMELLEKLLSSEGCVLTHSMKAAYCAVAVECTARHMVGVEVKRGKYVGVLKKIWVERIGGIKGRKSPLLSNDLEKWEIELNAAVDNERLRKMIRKTNTRNHALVLLKKFVAEEWALLGPPFLTTVVRMMEERSRTQRSDECENEPSHSVPKEVEVNTVKHRKEVISNLEKGSAGEENHPQRCTKKGGVDRNIVMDAGTSPSRDNGDTVKDVLGRGKALCFKEATMNHGKRAQREELGVDAFRDKQRRIDGSEKGGGRGPFSLRCESTHDDTDIRVVHATSPEHQARMIEGADPGDRSIRQEGSKEGVLPCEKGLGIRELIKELITKRQFDAPEAATEEGSLEMARRIDNEHRRGQKQKNVLQQSANGNAESTQVPNANLEKRSHQNEAQKPSLMERNSTAVSYLWNDSIEDAPDGNSPSRPAQGHNRRRRRMWTYEEVTALREGVKRFGSDWKAIKDSYPIELAKRTTIDLKDRWRNEVGR